MASLRLYGDLATASFTLKLSLTGPDIKQYSINTAGYDRSGRLDIDTFDVSPQRAGPIRSLDTFRKV